VGPAARPERRIIVSVFVIEEPGFPIEILPRESQQEVERDAGVAWAAVRNGVPEWFCIVVSPDRLLALIGDEPLRFQLPRLIFAHMASQRMMRLCTKGITISK